jgi:HAD superfamily hydrolase (TIGR01509 family)
VFNEAVMTTAVLFDLDGTLVDSNYLHVQAWSEAFERVGHPAEHWRVHRTIGLDGSRLLATFLPDDDDIHARAKRRHQKRFQRLARRLRPFDEVHELLTAIRAAGHKVVFSTSAPPDELELLLAALGVDDLVDAVTSADDVDVAKPDPGIIQVALDKVGVAAANAVFVGDTEWDGKACARAGVRFIGMRCGGLSDSELTAAGAVDVFDDPADLLARLSTSPIGSLEVVS